MIKGGPLMTERFGRARHFWCGRHSYVSGEQRTEIWRAESGEEAKIIKFLNQM